MFLNLSKPQKSPVRHWLTSGVFFSLEAVQSHTASQSSNFEGRMVQQLSSMRCLAEKAGRACGFHRELGVFRNILKIHDPSCHIVKFTYS